MSCRLVKRYMGGSTSFNGTTSTIPTDITSNDVFTSGNGFTLWRWIKPKSYGEIAGRIFDKTTNAATADGFRVVLGSSYSIEFNINGGTQRDSAARAIKINQWTLALVTVAPDATVTHYINGVVSGTPGTTGALSGITTANPLTIGNRSTATDRTFDGLMGEGGIVPRVLTQAEITALYTAGILPADTAHFFPLSDLPSTYLDTIGGATGTGSATTLSPSTPVQLPVAIDESNKASLSFDGVDDIITLPATNNGITTEMTVAYWVRIDNVTTQQFHCAALARHSLYPRTYHTTQKAVSLQYRIDGVTKAASSPNNFVNLNTWIFVAGTIKVSEGGKIYLNGKLCGVNTDTGSSITGGSTTPYIGGTSFASEWFKGLIHGFRLWNRALTAGEIRDLYFNNIIPQDGLVDDLPLNEGAGTIAYDQSGNGNDGTITGATWSAVVPSKAREVVTTRATATSRTNVTC